MKMNLLVKTAIIIAFSTLTTSILQFNFQFSILNAQTLKLEDCYRLASDNYPLVKQYSLIEKSKEFSIKNAQTGYLPQFGVYGQATYQSDVTQIPITTEMLQALGAPSSIKMPEITRDQYRVYGEVSYSLTGLATTKTQTDLAKANAEIESQKIEVELYKLRERINSLFFGILLIDAQIRQIDLVQNDLQNGIKRTEVAIANGVAVKSAADNLKAELLKTRQRTAELQAAREGYADMLSLFIGQKMDENMVLEKPTTPVETWHAASLQRPELKLFDLQNRALTLQNRLIVNKNLPQIGLFFQGGYGKPGLNMFKEGFDAYYITGVRLAWNISGFYTFKNDKRNIVNNQQLVAIQQDLFSFNTNLALSQQDAEIRKMQSLVADDDEIIRLRQNVKNATQTRLDNGTATTNDYLTAVNAEDAARQNKILHEIQLLMAQWNKRTTEGIEN